MADEMNVRNVNEYGVDLERAHDTAVRFADDICVLSSMKLRGDWWWRVYPSEEFARTRP